MRHSRADATAIRQPGSGAFGIPLSLRFRDEVRLAAMPARIGKDQPPHASPGSTGRWGKFLRFFRSSSPLATPLVAETRVKELVTHLSCIIRNMR
jgi:hypothetical protein